MSLFTRNLNKCGKDVTIQSRVESILNGDSAELFADIITIKGIIKTVKGVSIFDDTNTERVVTHEICIAARATLPLISVFNTVPFQAGATPSGVIPSSVVTGTLITITGALDDNYNLVDVPVIDTAGSVIKYTLLVDGLTTESGPDLMYSYLQEYTSENWIVFGSKRFKILNVENCCEKDEVLILMCTERGEDSKVVNEA